MADDEQAPGPAIVPVREQVVDFYGDLVPVAQAGPEELYVPLRTLATFLGLSVSGSRQRVMRHPVLAGRVRSVRMTGADGKRYETLCLPLDLLPGWLFGIDTRRVKPELQAKLIRYQDEAFRVLWAAFRHDIMPSPPPPPVDLSPVEQALALAEAVANLARQQLAYEGRLGTVETRQQVMADYLRGYIQKNEQRVTALELHLSAGAVISEAEAAELALHVKTVAAALEQHGTPNGYQRVYSELYRRFRIASYKNLPAARYGDALAWLQGWYHDLSKEEQGDGPTRG
jgi:hypothetical protein